MNLFKTDAKSPTAKHRQEVNTLKVDKPNNSSNETNVASVPKEYIEAKPHKDLLNTSKDAQTTQGVKQ